MPRLDPFAPMSTKSREIPFDFVLERLEPLGPTTRAMFGSTGVYLDERVICILRKKGDRDDGVWVCFEPDQHDAVHALLPNLARIERLGHVRNWRKLSATHDSFEDDVLRMCKLLLDGDTRIGKLPDRLKAKRKAATPKAATKKPATKAKGKNAAKAAPSAVKTRKRASGPKAPTRATSRAR